MTPEEINRRLLELFMEGSKLQIYLAQMAKQAIAEGWTDEQHAAARKQPLEEMTAMKQEIHDRLDQLKALKEQTGESDKPKP